MKTDTDRGQQMMFHFIDDNRLLDDLTFQMKVEDFSRLNFILFEPKDPDVIMTLKEWISYIDEKGVCKSGN